VLFAEASLVAQVTLEEVTHLADQLSTEEQQALVDHLSRRISAPAVGEPVDATVSGLDRPPKSLYGIWEGHFPEDFDVDAVLHEIRHEWEKEWPELFNP
jgi:hypothetical protein